ncbi:MAG: beta-propeller fold lactonase family protein [Cyclobacteriaceae bacterium]
MRYFSMHPGRVPICQFTISSGIFGPRMGRRAVLLTLLLGLTLPAWAQYGFEQVIRNSDEGIEGIGTPTHVLISPDNRQVYVAGYGDAALAVFIREDTTGQLTFQQLVKNGEGSVAGLTGVRQLAFSEDGRFVYTVSDQDHALTTFLHNEDGTLTFQGILRDGENGVDGLGGARALAVSPDGENIYVAAYADHAVSVFSVDSLSGEATFNQVVFDTGVIGSVGDLKLRTAISVAVSPDNRHVYLVGYEDDGLSVFARDTENQGRLTSVQNIDNWAQFLGFGNVRPTGVVSSHDGKNIYVSGFGGSYAGNLTVFSRNASNGRVEIVQRFADASTADTNFTRLDGLGRLASLTLTPDDRFVYTTAYDNGEVPEDFEITSFERNTDTGLLKEYKGITNGGIVEGTEQPNAIAFEKTGNYFYVVAQQESAVTTFSVFFPTITEISPSRGFPGSELIIWGDDFRAASISGKDSVTIGGVNAEVLDWTDTAITVRVPELALGTHPVAVTVNLYPSASVDFTIAVEIEAFSPALATSGTTIGIRGKNFGNDPSKVQVFFGEYSATEVVLITPDSLTAVVPELPSGAYAISVEIAGGESVVGRTKLTVDNTPPVPVFSVEHLSENVDTDKSIDVTYNERLYLEDGNPIVGCDDLGQVISLFKLIESSEESVLLEACYSPNNTVISINAALETDSFYKLMVDGTKLFDELGNRGKDTLILFTTGAYEEITLLENKYLLNQDSVLLQIKYSQAIKTAMLYYRGICSTESEKVLNLLDKNRFNARQTVAAKVESTGDLVGVEYFYKLVDHFGVDTTTRTYYTYHVLEDGEDLSVASGKSADDYQLLSFPLALDQPDVSDVFSDELREYDQEKWRLYTVDGAGKYVEYAGFHAINPGQAYLLIFRDKNVKQINSGPGERLHVRKDQPYTIPVHPGWNLIGNPSPLQIDWEQVAEDPANEGAEVSSYIRHYGPNWSDSSHQLIPGKGGLVFVQGNQNFISIPLSAKVATGGKRKEPEKAKGSWEVPLSVRQVEGGLFRTLAGFGMHPRADASADRYDAMRPPPFGDFLDITFRHPEYFYPDFAKDIRPVQDRHIWDFAVETSETGLLELRWNPGQLPSGDQPLQLVDRQENKVIDMRMQSYYSFPASEYRPFQIFYGPQDFMDEALTPSQIYLQSGYPNPFSREITIPFTLPPSEHDYQVQIDIYTLHGQRVRRLLDANLSTGFHEIQWNGTQGQGKSLPEGIYLCELRTWQGNVLDIQRKRLILMNE